MEEKIYEIITSQNKAITYEEIEEKLEEDEKEELPKTLVELGKNLKIRVTNKGKYEKFNDKSQKIGTLIVNPKGFGFVVVEGEEKDYYISKNNINGAINGDTVVISVIDDQKHEAVVRSINERNLNNLIVGEFYTKDNKHFIDVDDDKLNIMIEIDKEDTKGAVPGHKVVVKIDGNINKTNYYKGKIVRILGHKDDPGVDILSIAAKYNINDIFPDEVLKELETIPTEVKPEDIKNRKDLRNKKICFACSLFNSL